MDCANLSLGNTSLRHVVKSLLLLDHHLLLLRRGVGDRVVVGLWLISVSSLRTLDGITATACVVDVEQLAQLFLALLVLLSRENCLTRSIGGLMRDLVDVKNTLRVVRAEQRIIDADVVEVSLMLRLAIRSRHGLVGQLNGILRDSRCASVVIVDALVLLVHC